VHELRLGLEILGSKLTPPDDVTCDVVEAGGLAAEWVQAPNAVAPRVILYLHGGGYVLGSIASHRGLAGRLSRAAAARVLLLDYRLAPEHPFPAAVDDATAAYRWLLAQGVEPARLVIAGDCWRRADDCHRWRYGMPACLCRLRPCASLPGLTWRAWGSPSRQKRRLIPWYKKTCYYNWLPGIWLGPDRARH
jgi:hypothetical protein